MVGALGQKKSKDAPTVGGNQLLTFIPGGLTPGKPSMHLIIQTLSIVNDVEICLEF